MPRTVLLLLTLLALGCLLPAQNSPLNLTAPNGGEVWNIGSTYAITWTQVNLTGNVSLMLLGANAAGPGNIMIAQAVPVQDGVFSWTIPNNVIPGTQYRVRVTCPGNSGYLLHDISDGVFAIQGDNPPPPPQTYIQVTAPNGGETWPAGSTQIINWTYQNLEGEVRITLLRPNDNQQIVVTEAAPIAAGAYAWTIPATINPGLYKVHVQWLTILAVYFGDVSDNYFSITGGTPPPPPILNVTAPNGGETWVAGTMHPITWEFNGNGGAVMIQLMGGPQMSPIVIIAPNVPANAGIFHWYIPPYQMPGDAYQVQISLLDPSGTFIGDISDAPFSIVANDPPPQSITVTSPNGGETWVAGTMHPITWNFANLTGEVYIGLIAENMNSLTILAPAIGITEQHFNWTVPADIAPGRYMVQIVWITVLDVYIGDISDNYLTIVAGEDPPPQTLTVTSPNGGEQWIKGSWHDITWEGADPNSVVRILLVYGQQAPYRRRVIAPNVPNTGSFHWRVPNRLPAGDFYKVLIKRVNGGADTSDGYFSILAQNYNLKATPNPTEQSTKLSFDLDAPATVSVRIYNLKGQCVRTFVDQRMLDGKQSIYWDGNDSAGRKVSAGIYFARIASPELNAIHRIIVLR